MKQVEIIEFSGCDRFGVNDPEKLKCRVYELLTDIYKLGVRVHKGRRVVTGYEYAELYDWDMYFENLFLSYAGESSYGRNGVEMFLDKQEPSGFIPRTIGIVYPKPRHHFKPFLAQTALLSIRQSGDERWLKGKYFEKLEKYIGYWFRYCDSDKNGLCFWDGSDHSGMDNQEMRLGYIGQMEYEGVDLNVYLVRELLAMSELSSILGYIEKEIEYLRCSAKLSDKIHSTLWDEKSGFYYDRSEYTGKLNYVKSVTGLLPLCLDDLSPERADRLVKEHLLNTEEFWLEYPISTWAKNEKGFYNERRGEECNWMGPTWIPINYMVFHGLMKHGFMEEARLLAEKTYQLVISEDCTREYYDSQTGVGQGMCPFWGWSSLGYVMLLEYMLAYDPSDPKCSEFITIKELKIQEKK